VAAAVFTDAGSSRAVSEGTDAELDVGPGEKDDAMSEVVAAMARAPRTVALRTAGFMAIRVGQ
jgi:hypothetical protein